MEPLDHCPGCGREVPPAVLAESDPPLCRPCRFQAERRPARCRPPADSVSPLFAVPPVGDPGSAWAAVLPGWLFGSRWEGCSLEVEGYALPPDAPRVAWQVRVGTARVQVERAVVRHPGLAPYVEATWSAVEGQAVAIRGLERVRSQDEVLAGWRLVALLRLAVQGRPVGSLSGYSRERAAAIVAEAERLHAEGVTWAGVAARLYLSVGTLKRWRVEFGKGP